MEREGGRMGGTLKLIYIRVQMHIYIIICVHNLAGQ